MTLGGKGATVAALFNIEACVGNIPACLKVLKELTFTLSFFSRFIQSIASVFSKVTDLYHFPDSIFKRNF